MEKETSYCTKPLLNKLSRVAVLYLCTLAAMIVSCAPKHSTDAQKIVSFFKRQRASLECLSSKNNIVIVNTNGCQPCLQDLASFIARNEPNLSCTGFIFVGNSEKTIHILFSSYFRSAGTPYCFIHNRTFKDITGVWLEKSARIHRLSTTDEDFQWVSTVNLTPLHYCD